MATTVRDAPERSRYEIVVDDTGAGFAAYRDRDGVRVLTHTEVDGAFQGKGVGSDLARGALDDVRARGLDAEVRCPFLTTWIRRHPDYADVARAA